MKEYRAYMCDFGHQWSLFDVGLNGDRILELIHGEAAKKRAVTALAKYEQFSCSGVPTWVVESERF